MQKILEAAYPNPKGIEAGWYRGITGKAAVTNGPFPYSLDALFLNYFCNPYNSKGIEVNGETGTWFYIWANQVSGWFAEFIKYYRIQKQPVFLLQKRVGTLSGYPLYEGIDKGTSNTGTRYSRFILLFRKGNSPYVSVTQKQFLQSFLNYNEKRYIKNLAEEEKNIHHKTEEEEEVIKQKGLEGALQGAKPNYIEQRKAEYLKNYRTTKQKHEDWIIKLQKMYDDDMKPARMFLENNSEQQLEQPAILDYDNLLTFKYFSTPDNGGRELVRLNPDYFNTTLPRYIPQTLVVYWSWNKGKPEEYFREQLEKNLDFNALQQMIDK